MKTDTSTENCGCDPACCADGDPEGGCCDETCCAMIPVSEIHLFEA